MVPGRLVVCIWFLFTTSFLYLNSFLKLNVQKVVSDNYYFVTKRVFFCLRSYIILYKYFCFSSNAISCCQNIVKTIVVTHLFRIFFKKISYTFWNWILLFAIYFHTCAEVIFDNFSFWFWQIWHKRSVLISSLKCNF